MQTHSVRPPAYSVAGKEVSVMTIETAIHAGFRQQLIDIG